MDQTTRATLVAQYRQGYDEIVAALRDITDSGLDAREAPGEWSPREIVHHLADSEMTSALRLRRLIAEENPQIVGYDQEEFARRLYYDQPIAPSLAAFRAAWESTAAILDRMTDDEWARQGTHSESGPYPVTSWLEIYAVHAHDHAHQIRRARAVANNESVAPPHG
jgi:DinB superfamily